MFGFVKIVETEEKVKKLSDLILEGSKLNRKARNAFTDYDECGEITTCAIAAAYVAKYGMHLTEATEKHIEKTLGIKLGLQTIIMLSNDFFRLPRPVIAYGLKLVGK